MNIITKFGAVTKSERIQGKSLEPVTVREDEMYKPEALQPAKVTFVKAIDKKYHW